MRKRSALMTCLTLLTVSSCAYSPKRLDVDLVSACGVRPSQEIIELSLDKNSTVEDYQRALITRIAELKLAHKDIERIAKCIEGFYR